MARNPNRVDGATAAVAERSSRPFNPAPTRRADANDPLERKGASKPATDSAPPGSIAAIEARLGF